jgi:hypothetical protein
MLLYICFITRDDITHRGPYDVIILTTDVSPTVWCEHNTHSGLSSLGALRAFNDLPVRRRIERRWAAYRLSTGLYRLVRSQVERLMNEFTVTEDMPLCSTLIPPRLPSADMSALDGDNCPTVSTAVCVLGPSADGVSPDMINSVYVHHPMYLLRRWLTANYPVDRVSFTAADVPRAYTAWVKTIDLSLLPPPLTIIEFDRVCRRHVRVAMQLRDSVTH